jgi:hypothetical protein
MSEHRRAERLGNRHAGAAAPSRAQSSLADREVRRLLDEVFGPEGGSGFLATPRRSLGGRTPAELLEAGDADPVREALIKLLTGDFG